MGTFEDALRERLNIINGIGEEQTTWSKLHNARLRDKQMQDQLIAQREAQYNAMVAQNANGARMQNGFGYTGGTAQPASGFEAFKASIGRKESSNNYSARNTQSGAMGKYQIMPSNLGGRGNGWDYEALGYDVTPQQFMQSPEIQEKVASYKLQQYYNKYGPAGASVAWYAGPSAAQRYSNSGQVSTSREFGGYPSVQAYMQAVLRGM